MATRRLTPSSYQVSSAEYLSVSSPENMYSNTDSSTFATITNSAANWNAYYFVVNGFNFSAIPSGAIVESFSIKLKLGGDGLTTEANYSPFLSDGVAQATSPNKIDGSSYAGTMSDNVQILTFTGVTLTWDQIVSYGSSFSIGVYCRRQGQEQLTNHAYMYGAEIEVNFNVPDTPVSGVSLSRNSVTLGIGGSCSLYPVFEPDYASDTSVTWSTSDSTVATVSDGTVSALALGTADITVTTNDGGYTAVCSVDVSSDVTYVFAKVDGAWESVYRNTFNVNIGGTYYNLGTSGDIWLRVGDTWKSVWGEYNILDNEAPATGATSSGGNGEGTPLTKDYKPNGDKFSGVIELERALDGTDDYIEIVLDVTECSDSTNWPEVLAIYSATTGLSTWRNGVHIYFDMVKPANNSRLSSYPGYTVDYGGTAGKSTRAGVTFSGNNYLYIRIDSGGIKIKVEGDSDYTTVASLANASISNKTSIAIGSTEGNGRSQATFISIQYKAYIEKT